LATLDQDYFLWLPSLDRLLLAIAQQPLGVFAVSLALTQMHLDKALDNKQVYDGYLSVLFMQVISQRQVIRASGFHDE
jgi:hypothetical protein